MKPLSIAGLVLVVLGAIALVYGGLSFTSKDTIVDAGPVQITKDKKHGIAVPPLVGGLAVLGGIALIVMGRRAGR
jgi:hypothetical protein